ncbi:hypothetical protein As57867_013032, partial [Aphanomyces stellatus]
SGFEWLQKGLEGVEGAQEWLDSCVSSGERTNDSESVKETTEEPATDNDGLPNVVQTASERPTVTHVQGAALREFTQWMLQHDCERTFGGLKRVITSNGTVLWTSSDSIDSIKAASPKEREYSPLLCAAHFGCDDVIAFLLQQPHIDVNLANGHGFTALNLACERGFEDIALRLLRHPGTDLNKCDGDGDTPLMMASKAGLSSVVDELLAKLDVAAVDQPGKENQTAMHYAAEGGSLVVVQSLVAYPGTRHNLKDAMNRTPLHVASGLGHADVVHFMLDHGLLDANGLDCWDQTAMHWAVNHGKEDSVRALIGHVDLTIQDYNNSTAFKCAVEQGYSAIEKLLSARDQVGLQVMETHTPEEAGKALIQALKNGQGRAVLALLQLGAIDVYAKDENGNTALMLACQTTDLEIVDAILTRQDFLQTLNERGEYGRSALAHAVCGGPAYIVERLLQVPDIDFTLTDEVGERWCTLMDMVQEGDMVLGLACGFDSVDVVKLLLTQPAVRLHINWQSLAGDTALHYASCGSHSAIIQTLLKVPDIHDSLRNYDGLRPIDLALEAEQYNAVNEFIVSITTFDPAESNCFVSTPPTLQKNRPSRFCSSIYASLQFAPTYICQELAFATDQDGRKAIDITDATTRSYLHSQLYFCSRYKLFHGPPVHVSNTAVVVMAYDHGLCEQVFDENAKNGELTQDGFVKCSQLLGRLTAERTAATQKKHLRAKEAWEMEFRLWDSDNSGQISKDEFLKYGIKYFGGRIKVALKFMMHESEYNRELKNPSLMSDDFALQCLPSVDEATFQACVAHLTINDDMNMSSYRHLLVMPAADRSLEDIHLRNRPSEMKIKAIVHEVATTLAHLHKRNLVHGDLKKLNILRVENKFKLIDFDATTRVGQSIGAKFSSGILPPELFHELNSTDEVAAYESYWADYREDKMVWNKIKPKKKIVVKSFRPEMGVSLLPYELVAATPAVDMWSLGCLIYQMHCNEELVSTDINQDVVLDRIKMAAEWTDEALWKRIETNIPDEAAQDLVKKLLVRNPLGRISAKGVLEHWYFTPEKRFAEIHKQIQATTEENIHFKSLLDDTAALQYETQALQRSSHVQLSDHLEQSTQAVMRGLLDAGDIVAPTSFVVLPAKLNFLAIWPIDDVFAFIEELAPTVTALATAFSTLANESSLTSALRVATDLTKALGQIDGGEPMYLYLVDEGSGKIVARENDPVYPIEIRRNDTSFWGSALACVEAGLKWLQTGVEDVKDMQGWLDKWVLPEPATTYKETKEQESPSRLTHEAAQAVVTHSSVTHAQGAALREFAQWMLQRDTDRTFGGLKRVVTSSGSVIWTASDSIESFGAISREKSIMILLVQAFASFRFQTLKRLTLMSCLRVELTSAELSFDAASDGYPLAVLRMGSEERMAQGEWSSRRTIAWTDSDQQLMEVPLQVTNNIVIHVLLCCVRPHQVELLGRGELGHLRGDQKLVLVGGRGVLALRITEGTAREKKTPATQSGFSVSWTSAAAVEKDLAEKAEKKLALEAELLQFVVAAEKREAKRAQRQVEKERRRLLMVAIIKLQARWRGRQVRKWMVDVRKQVERERRKAAAKKNVRERALKRHEEQVSALRMAKASSGETRSEPQKKEVNEDEWVRGKVAKTQAQLRTKLDMIKERRENKVRALAQPQNAIDPDLIRAIRFVHCSK